MALALSVGIALTSAPGGRGRLVLLFSGVHLLFPRGLEGLSTLFFLQEFTFGLFLPSWENRADSEVGYS